MLPKVHGLDVLKRVRRDSDVPILVLSAVRESRTTVRALELGCDDFLTKPFWPEELLARVHARLRRPTSVKNERMEWSGLVLDLGAHRVTLEGQDLELTPVEFDILAALARRPHAAVPRIDLAIEVLDPGREGTDRTLDVHISRLRKKLGDRSSCIATVWGVGYRFEGGEPT